MNTTASRPNLLFRFRWWILIAIVMTLLGWWGITFATKGWISEEQASRIVPAMSKEQVISILGEPAEKQAVGTSIEMWLYKLPRGYPRPDRRQFCISFEQDGTVRGKVTVYGVP